MQQPLPHSSQGPLTAVSAFQSNWWRGVGFPLGPVNHGRLLDGSAGLNELYGAFRVCIEPLPTLGVPRDCEFTCVIATGLVPSLVPGVEKKCDVYPPTVGSTLKTLSAVQRLRHKRPEAAGSPVKKEAGRPEDPTVQPFSALAVAVHAFSVLHVPYDARHGG